MSVCVCVCVCVWVSVGISVCLYERERECVSLSSLADLCYCNLAVPLYYQFAICVALYETCCWALSASKYNHQANYPDIPDVWSAEDKQAN